MEYLHKSERLLPNEWVDWIRAYKGQSPLSADDFLGKTVKLKLKDGSKFKFKKAFFVKGSDGLAQEIAVFTENAGYYVFSQNDIKKLKGMSRSFANDAQF